MSISSDFNNKILIFHLSFRHCHKLARYVQLLYLYCLCRCLALTNIKYVNMMHTTIDVLLSTIKENIYKQKQNKKLNKLNFQKKGKLWNEKTIQKQSNAMYSYKNTAKILLHKVETLPCTYEYQYYIFQLQLPT